MDWKTLLAYITGTVDQELLLRNEYLVTENRILRNQIKGRVRLSTGEHKALAEIGQKLGKQALEQVATIVKPDTILAWHRKRVAQKFDGSQQRKALGRPKIDQELEALVVRMAQENRSWGYDRMVGALANLWYTISDQTVGNILKRHGISPAPERKTTTTWKEFIRTHMDALVATDFFTAEVWTWYGLVTYYSLFFIHLGSRKVYVAGVTPHPNEQWMRQIARNVTMEAWGFLAPGQYLIHDRDGKYCPIFQQIIDAAGIKRIPLPARSPNLNAYAERWVRSVKEECLSRLILFGEASLRHALTQYVEHFHHERNHQGKGNVLLLPAVSQGPAREGSIQCRERLGGLLKYYERKAHEFFGRRTSEAIGEHEGGTRRMEPERAQASLRAAELCLAQGLLDSAVNRAYFAPFQAAICALEHRGIRRREWTHKGVHSDFVQIFVRRRKLVPASFAGALPSVLQLRHMADYQQPGVSQPQAVRRAHEFVTLLQSEVFDGP